MSSSQNSSYDYYNAFDLRAIKVKNGFPDYILELLT